MNFDELGNSWRQQNNEASELDPTEVLANVVRRAERGRITNILMGVVGLVLSLLVVRDFGNTLLYDSNTLVRVGAAMCVLGALGLIAQTIFYSFWPSQISGQAICDYLSRELQRTKKVIASSKSPFTYRAICPFVNGRLFDSGGRPSSSTHDFDNRSSFRNRRGCSVGGSANRFTRGDTTARYGTAAF